MIHNIPFINLPSCPLLDYIKNGTKTVEGRKNSSTYHNIKKDDIIIFKTKGETDVYAKVTYVNKYKTLEDYLKTETIEKTLPCVKSLEEGIQMYNRWSSEKERNELKEKYGYAFLGIGISVISHEQFVSMQKYWKYKSKYLKFKNNNKPITTN